MPPRRARQSLKPQAPNDETSVYRELLAEDAQSRAPDRESRPLKKRRTRPPTPEDRRGVESHEEDGQRAKDEDGHEPLRQVIYNDSTSSGGDDESDAEFEDVDLGLHSDSSSIGKVEPDSGTQDLVIQLDIPRPSTSKGHKQRRLPSSKVEKEKRVQIHKLHICCSLVHLYVRNSWCNDTGLHRTLRRLLSKKTLIYLHPKATDSQFGRSRSFTEGLQQASDTFRLAYQITARGSRRPVWDASGGNTSRKGQGTDCIVAKHAFLDAARLMQGSRDDGAQLFCACLRSAGVDARLACSLQVLAFNATVPSMSTTIAGKHTITQAELEHDMAQKTFRDRLPARQSSVEASEALDREQPRPVKRFGRSAPSSMDLGKAPPTPVKRKPIIESPHPVYWVEAFNEASQEWLPVDPLVTKTVAKPTKFEPPASDSSNAMVYVVAFDADGTAKDVTQRYSRAYNAKTRRTRVESTKGGVVWWNRTMKLFFDGEADRDQVEDAQLANRTAAEPMPRNVQDFKDHPRYALVRHLKHNEIIDPTNEVGRITTSKSGDTTEPIYRRQDVRVVKSAIKWYQEGRDIKEGEQPLKYAVARRDRRQRELSAAASSDEEGAAGTGLYAHHQTILYIPPPVVRGKVPRNAYGNLDVYVPSMIPPGGVHVRAREAVRASRLIGVDFAEAVTGFQFKGRKGTAVTDGVIVGREFAAAVEEVVRGLRWLQHSDELQKRTLLALKTWRRFYTGLRVVQRVRGYAEQDGEADIAAQLDEEEDRERRAGMQGGFVPAERWEDRGGDLQEAGVVRDDAAARAINSIDPLESTDRAPPDLDDHHMSTASPWDTEAAAVRPLRKPKTTYGKSKPVAPAGIGGGGFMADVDMAGGFITDDGRVRDGAGDTLHRHEGDGGGGFFPPEDETARFGGGFLVDEEGKDGNGSPPQVSQPAEKLQAVPATVSPLPDAAQTARNEEMSASASRPPRGSSPGDGLEAVGTLDDKAAGVEVHTGPVHTGPVLTGPAFDDDDEAMDDEDEATSLVSHDPDDEDAEPDWI